MRRGILFALSVGVAVQAQRSGQVSAEPNAAIKYLRADISLRQSYPLPPEAWIGLEEALKRPLDATDEKMVASAADALNEFAHGANIENCQWDLSAEDGPFANTAHRGAVRELVAVAALRARIRVREGQMTGAIQDLVDGYAAARHLSLDGSLASVLFDYKIENEVTRVLEQALSLMSASEVDDLQSHLSKLPHGATMESALESEKLGRNDLLDAIRGATTRDEVVDHLMRGVPTLQGKRRAAEQIVDGCGGSVAGITDCIQNQSDFYKKWSSQFNLSPEQFQRLYETDFAHKSARNPVLARFTPSLSRLRWAEAYNKTERALVRAAVAVERSGANELLRFPDPADGRPFAYSQLSNGFRLESRLRQDGQPLSISVLRSGQHKSRASH